MKQIIIAALLVGSLALAGCDTMAKRDQNIIIKYKYIVNVIPGDLLAIPTRPIKVDPAIDTDETIATWLLDGEKRALQIEGSLKAIKTLQDQRLEELKKLPADDVILK
jgi:hypothetical protein